MNLAADPENMALTKKDREEVLAQAERFRAAVRPLEPLIRPFLWLITRSKYVQRKLASSGATRVGQIARLAERGEHRRAAALAMEALSDTRKRRQHEASSWHLDYWWFFAHEAARSLENLDDHEARTALIALAEEEEAPEEDFEAASCFLIFASWEYEAGHYDRALAFAERAVRTDETWGEPAFLLGWYRLVLGGGDPLEAFLEAVRREPDLLFRIAGDPECRRHPHILQRLKAATAETLLANGEPRPA